MNLDSKHFLIITYNQFKAFPQLIKEYDQINDYKNKLEIFADFQLKQLDIFRSLDCYERFFAIDTTEKSINEVHEIISQHFLDHITL